MAPFQKRWHCPDCNREWVYKTPESGPQDNCPRCGSPNIERIEFRGFFDTPTNPELLPVPMSVIVGPLGGEENDQPERRVDALLFEESSVALRAAHASAVI